MRDVGSASCPETRALRQRMLAELRTQGHLHSERVAAALETVPRELFVPGVNMDEVYRSAEAIVTKRIDGVGVSSASAPNVIAIMLEQLEVRPGDHVLEIGAGTGYNAALLAFLVGPTGSVTSLDIDEDLVLAAREHLRVAGFESVNVVARDGALGYAEGQVFDRIILTVGSRDIAPAWREQLAQPDGRLVLPLRLRGPQRSIAFRPEDGHLVSTTVQACQFIPLRGLLAAPPALLRIGPQGGISITSPDEHLALPAELLADLLNRPRQVWPTGVSVSADQLRDALEVWLVVHEPSACTIYAEPGVHALPDLFGYADRVRGSLGLFERDGLALLSWMPGHQLGVEAPAGSAAQAQRLVELIRGWHAAGRPGDAQLEVHAYPRGQAPAPEPGVAVVDERWTRFVIRWRPAPPT